MLSYYLFTFRNRAFERRLDEHGQLKNIAFAGADFNLITFTYDSLSRPDTMQQYSANRGPILNGRLSYDLRGREYTRSYNNGGLYAQTTLYDANSNIASESLSGSIVAASGQYVYTHDPLNRITDQTRPNAQPRLDWAYDKVGNWAATNQNNPLAPQEQRTVNADNEYASIDGDTSRLVYGARGNLINDELYEALYKQILWAHLQFPARHGGILQQHVDYLS